MEPTGHYWFCLAKFLRQNRIKIDIVNPMHVKKSKELDDNSPSKIVSSNTDEGIIGIGEVEVWGFLDAAEEVLKKLKGYLIWKGSLSNKTLLAAYVSQYVF